MRFLMSALRNIFENTHKWLKIPWTETLFIFLMVLHKKIRYITQIFIYKTWYLCFEHINIFTRAHADMRSHLLQGLKRTSRLRVHLLCVGMTLFPLVATGMRSFRYSSGRYFSISIFTGVASVTKPCLRKTTQTVSWAC